MWQDKEERAVIYGIVTRKLMEKLRKRKSGFSKFVCTGLFWHHFPVFGDKTVLPFLTQKGHLSQGKVYDPLLGRKGRSESSLPGSSTSQVQCLQLKIINIPKHHLFFCIAHSKPLHISGQKLWKTGKCELVVLCPLWLGGWQSLLGGWLSPTDPRRA